VTDQLIAPVIPPAAGPPGVYGMRRIDASGRLTSQAISHILNWRPGDRLTLTADASVVLVHRDPHDMVTVLAGAPLRSCGGSAAATPTAISGRP
jgi:hypothetical protein